MERKRHSDREILRLLHEIKVYLSGGLDVGSAGQKAGVSDVANYTWRTKLGGMGRSQPIEMRALQNDNDRWKKIEAELELDKPIL